MNKRNLAFLLAFTASLIYGISFTVAKDVMPQYIQAYGFILLRVAGATLLFWLIGLQVPREKIALQDFFRFFLAALFGVALNMLTFFKGLSLTTPINGAIIMVTTPILVLIFSFVFLHEKITIKKIIGVLLGMSGAIALITYGQQAVQIAPDIKWGNFLVFINAASYSLYLIIAKPLLKKYHPVHFIKWMYLMGLIMVIPFGWKQVMQVAWMTNPSIVLYKIGFIVVFTTFITYLFNLIALKNLKPTTLSVFIYLQPLIASIYAIAVGSDQLTLIKITGTLLIFSGVYMVSHQKKKV